MAESTGKDRNIPYRYAWRYRDYVIDAFNHGKPYNRFIVEQLAGDLLPAKDAADHDKLVVATGFLAIGPKGVNVTKPEQFRMDQIDDQIDVTSRAFLGMTVACAAATIISSTRFRRPTTTRWRASFIARRPIRASRRARSTADEARLLKLSDPAQQPKVSAEAAAQEKARQREIAKFKPSGRTAQSAETSSGRSKSKTGEGQAQNRRLAGQSPKPIARIIGRRSRKWRRSSKNWRAFLRRTPIL